MKKIVFSEHSKMRMLERDIKLTYDKEANAAYIYVKDKIAKGEVKQTIALKDEVVLDFDSKKKLIGIEILNAAKLIPANVLRVAVAK